MSIITPVIIKSETIQYNNTKKFKFTCTSDYEVRIKIPDRFKETQFEQDWIDTCRKLATLLLDVGLAVTLRCRPEKYPILRLFNGRGKLQLKYNAFDGVLSIPSSVEELRISESHTPKDYKVNEAVPMMLLGTDGTYCNGVWAKNKGV